MRQTTRGRLPHDDVRCFGWGDFDCILFVCWHECFFALHGSASQKRGSCAVMHLLCFSPKQPFTQARYHDGPSMRLDADPFHHGAERAESETESSRAICEASQVPFGTIMSKQGSLYHFITEVFASGHMRKASHHTFLHDP